MNDVKKLLTFFEMPDDAKEFYADVLAATNKSKDAETEVTYDDEEDTVVWLNLALTVVKTADV